MLAWRASLFCFVRRFIRVSDFATEPLLLLRRPMANGVYYATTDDGLALPLVDVTNPAFAVTATDAELAAMSDRFVRESTQRQEIPAPLREALRRSMLGRGLMAA